MLDAYLTLCKASSYLESRVFDRLLGVSTSGTVYAEDSLTTTGSDNLSYHGCGWLAVRRILKDLSPGPADVFVDIGSGKGQALLIAGRLPFKRVAGVEVDEELSQCARRNIEQARCRLRVQDVSVVTANALGWAIPDDTSIIFLYNPFVGQTFRTVSKLIFDSYDRRPRTIHIIYAIPWEHNWLLSTGRAVVDNVRPGRWPSLPLWWLRGNVMVSYKVVSSLEARQHEPRPPGYIFGRRRAFRIWSGPSDFRFSASQPGHGTVFSGP